MNELDTLRIELRELIDQVDARILAGEILTKQEIQSYNDAKQEHKRLCILLMEQM